MVKQRAVRTLKYRSGMNRLGIACGLITLFCGARGIAAGTNRIDAVSDTNDEEMMEMPELEPGTPHTIVDTVQRSASLRILSVARWVDSFFNDPEYAEEEAYARASFEQYVTFYRNLDAEYRTSVRATVVLPNLERKFRLSLEGDNENYLDNDSEEADEVRDVASTQSADDISMRLQYLFLQRPAIDVRVSGGIRVSDPALYGGPRLKLQTGIGSRWDARFTQRVYWYTTNDLKSKIQLRFDRLLGKYNLFRQSFSSSWDTETHADVGFSQGAVTSITQPLSKKAALRYAWSSVYVTRPDPRWTSSTVSFGYRQSVWREWLILEGTPFITWEEEFNWDPKPGLVISLSIIFEKANDRASG